MPEVAAISPVDTVRAFFDGIGSGDLGAIARHAAPDIVYVIYGADESTASTLPWAGRHMGHDAVRAAFSAIQAELSIGEFSIDSMFADGGEVAAFGRYRATSRSTGRSFETPFGQIATVVDGLIRRCTMSEDSHAVAAAIGTGDSGQRYP